MAITKKQRKDAEDLIYDILETLDTTGTNTDYYKKVFSKMSDDNFEKLFKQDFPLRFHIKDFEVEPTIKDITKAARKLKVPLLEKVNIPYLYTNKDGKPMNTKECLVGYLHIKKVQQFITKKNAMSTDIAQRDMKTGLLINYDKNGKTSDREAEALIAMGLKHTVDEFTGFKADYMNAKNTAYNQINQTGTLSLKDISMDQNDSLSKQYMDVYMIGAMLKSNIISDSYLLPYYSNQNK